MKPMYLFEGRKAALSYSYAKGFQIIRKSDGRKGSVGSWVQDILDLDLPAKEVDRRLLGLVS